MKSVRAVISGRVQGVFYRESAKKKAEGLGVRGYVKNLPDGTVELLAQGNNSGRLLEWCRSGPPAGRVDDIKEEEVDMPEHKDFQIHW